MTTTEFRKCLEEDGTSLCPFCEGDVSVRVPRMLLDLWDAAEAVREAQVGEWQTEETRRLDAALKALREEGG